MNQRTFERLGGGVSQCARIFKRLAAKRGKWVPMPELARIGSGKPHGFCMVHSRISDLEKRTGVKIDNRIQRNGTEQLSFYRIK